MAAPVSNPPTARSGKGHHAGTEVNPSAVGSVSNNRCRPWLIAHRNQYAAAEMGTPRTAAKTSTRRYGRERITADGSSDIEAPTHIRRRKVCQDLFLRVVLHAIHPRSPAP